eukprot:jgi/Ulvmu1/915/UM101_0024.1
MEIDVPDIDQFGSNANRKIKVWSTDRFLACVDLVAKIDLPVDAAWRLLTHQENSKIFSSIKRTGERTYRKNNFFEKQYEVDHITGWSVLWFSGEFKTRLRVTESKRNGKVHFKLLSSDIMKDFDGEWTLKPCTQQALDRMYGKKDSNPFSAIKGIFGPSKHSRKCLIEFTQQVQPKSVPAPLRGLARRIAASALKTTMDDLDKEARRIHAGKPTLPGFEGCIDNVVAAKAPVASVALSGASDRQCLTHEASYTRQQVLKQAGMLAGNALGRDLPFPAWHLSAWQHVTPLTAIV